MRCYPTFISKLFFFFFNESKMLMLMFHQTWYLLWKMLELQFFFGENAFFFFIENMNCSFN